jgi:MraZ protein
VADWFVSTFTNKLDAKGRVSVPAQFRSVLAAQATDGLYCIKALSRQPALTGFGEALLSKLSEQMDAPNPLLDKNYATRAFGMFGQVRDLSIDDEGRVRLPDEFIAHCGITDRVAFLGLNKVFEIWNPDTLAAEEAKRMADVYAAYDASGGEIA